PSKSLKIATMDGAFFRGRGKFHGSFGARINSDVFVQNFRADGDGFKGGNLKRFIVVNSAALRQPAENGRSSWKPTGLFVAHPLIQAAGKFYDPPSTSVATIAVDRAVQNEESREW